MNVLEELVLEYSGWQMIDYECCMCMCLWQKNQRVACLKSTTRSTQGNAPFFLKERMKAFPILMNNTSYVYICDI